jgi:hypothetical protein
MTDEQKVEWFRRRFPVSNIPDLWLLRSGWDVPEAVRDYRRGLALYLPARYHDPKTPGSFSYNG